MRTTLFSLIFICFFIPQTASAKALSTTDKVVKKFMNLDTNGSGSVSLKEYRAMVMRRMNTRFSQMDTNKDGNISKEEYRRFWTNTKSKYYRPRRN